MPRFQLQVRNALDAPWPLADKSVHAIVTSPPYWSLRDYGFPEQIGLERDLGTYVERMVAVFRECRRVLRDDGVCWVNLGDTHYTAKGASWNPGHTAKERHYELRGVQATPDGKDAPNRMMRAKVARRYGLKPNDLVGVPWRVAFALQADGWVLRSDVVWSKPNPMPESVRSRPTRSHEYVFLLAKGKGYFYDADAIREPYTAGTFARINQSTFDTQEGGPKDPRTGNRSSRRALENLERRVNGDEAVELAGANARTVWEVVTEPYPDAHFATMPTELARRLIASSTSSWGCCPSCKAAITSRGPRCRCAAASAGESVPCVVLDPFAGSGTTLLVAQRLGRDSIGYEGSEVYARAARRRIRRDTPLFPALEERPAALQLEL